MEKRTESGLQDIHYQQKGLISKGPLTLYSQIIEKLCKIQFIVLREAEDPSEHRHGIQLCLKRRCRKICVNYFRHCRSDVWGRLEAGRQSAATKLPRGRHQTETSLSKCNAVHLKVRMKL